MWKHATASTILKLVEQLKKKYITDVSKLYRNSYERGASTPVCLGRLLSPKMLLIVSKLTAAAKHFDDKNSLLKFLRQNDANFGLADYTNRLLVFDENIAVQY